MSYLKRWRHNKARVHAYAQETDYTARNEDSNDAEEDVQENNSILSVNQEEPLQEPHNANPQVEEDENGESDNSYYLEPDIDYEYSDRILTDSESETEYSDQQEEEDFLPTAMYSS